VRLTAAAAIVVTLTTTLGAAILVLTLVSSVRANVDTTLDAYAASIARSTTPGGRLPEPLPAAPGDPGMWAQAVDSTGAVISSTPNVASLPALYTLSTDTTTPTASGNRDDERVVAQRYVIGTTPVVIYAGASTRLLSIVTTGIQGHLLLTLPVILLVALALSWLLIGRTLRPVERIRAEAAEITGSDLHRRIRQPPGDDEIGRLTRTLNDMLARLESSSSRQRRFVADASHELRTPLAALRTSLEVGMAHPDHAPWPTLAERAVAETTRLQRLVEDLLILARADDDHLPATLEHVDLSALVRTTAAATAARHEIAVHADEEVFVVGDPDQLTRLVRNLLDNADRHAAGKVRIAVSSRDRVTAVLQVADDGPGIPPGDRERIFDRFVSLRTSRTRHKGSADGTGLGLSITREIVLAHGGTITASAENPPLAGATFTAYLPADRTRGLRR
jgi:signal transduction histidine kinase